MPTNEKRSKPVERSYHCPCCGKSYLATVIFGLGCDADKILATPGFEQCGFCEEPCCPNCEFVAGETVLCTRCTNFSGCTHDPADRDPFLAKPRPTV